MSGFAKAMRQKKRENSFNGSAAPRGFDILLADAMLQFKMTEDEVKKLGEMTRDRQIACATVGTKVYYRRATLERLFAREEQA